MHTFYADDSNLRLNIQSSIPDTLLFGGIIIKKSDEKRLVAIIDEAKKPYGKPCIPIKWNFKDLKADYQKGTTLEVYNNMLADSNVWRQRILQNSLSINYTIVISGIHSFSSDRLFISKETPNFTRYAFTNVLQRVALEAKDLSVEHMEVVLDWPSGNKYQPFTDEFREAYNNGRSIDNHKYISGPLRNLSFCSTPKFSHSRDSHLLQFTDLVVGAVKDGIHTALNDKPESFGTECTKMIAPKFRGYPDSILSKGLALRPFGINQESKLRKVLSPLKNVA
jgi:hypothetical protein